VDGHRRVHQPGHDGVAADAVAGVRRGDAVGEGVHAGLGDLVGGEVPGRGDGGGGGDVDDGAATALAHDGQHVLAREPHRLQVHLDDAVPGVLLEADGAAVARTDADVVVEDVD